MFQNGFIQLEEGFLLSQRQCQFLIPKGESQEREFFGGHAHSFARSNGRL
jgi:hypothetical protein